jgi:hypothetical protein
MHTKFCPLSLFACGLFLFSCGGGGSSNSLPTHVQTTLAVTQQPQNQAVTAGQTATFSVTATGTAPLGYQWKKDSAAIDGATGASYTTPVTTTADSGSTFTVTVSNSAGNVTSSAAILTVTSVAARSNLFPSVKTFCYLPGDVSNSMYLEDSKAQVQFWVNHFDLLIGGEPRTYIKELKPTLPLYVYSVLTTMIDYDGGSKYMGSFLKLKTWVDEHYNDSKLGLSYPSAEAALETCFMHSKIAKTYTFAMGGELAVAAYEASNPKPSRIPGPWAKGSATGGDWCMNLRSDVYRAAWLNYFMGYRLEGYDGFMLDVHTWPNEQAKDGQVVEFATRADYKELLKDYNKVIHEYVQAQRTPQGTAKQFGINNSKQYVRVDNQPPRYEYADDMDFMLRESAYEYGSEWVTIKEEIDNAFYYGGLGKTVLLHHVNSFNEGSHDSALTKEEHLHRDWMAGLSVYLLAQNGPVYHYAYPGTNYYLDKRDTSWFGAMAHDLGQPVGPYYEFDAVPDPTPLAAGANTTDHTCTVFARKYEKALVLFKPYKSWTRAKLFDSQTATTHQLGKSYRPLLWDGSPGAPITEIKLKQWEGAILLPQ